MFCFVVILYIFVHAVEFYQLFYYLIKISHWDLFYRNSLFDCRLLQTLSSQSADCRLLQTLSVCVCLSVCPAFMAYISPRSAFDQTWWNVDTSVRLIVIKFYCATPLGLCATGQKDKIFCLSMRFRAFWDDWDTFIFFKNFCKVEAQNVHERSKQNACTNMLCKTVTLATAIFLSVCLSRFYGLYPVYYGSDFDQTLWKCWNFFPIDCIKMSLRYLKAHNWSMG